MSAIILAGGASKRLGEENGMVQLGNRPLVLHVLDCARSSPNDLKQAEALMKHHAY
jgi:molybdopterin-guanine dinucleotide biosynthesis protein A